MISLISHQQSSYSDGLTVRDVTAVCSQIINRNRDTCRKCPAHLCFPSKCRGLAEDCWLQDWRKSGTENIIHHCQCFTGMNIFCSHTKYSADVKRVIKTKKNNTCEHPKRRKRLQSSGRVSETILKLGCLQSIALLKISSSCLINILWHSLEN